MVEVRTAPLLGGSQPVRETFARSTLIYRNISGYVVEYVIRRPQFGRLGIDNDIRHSYLS